MRVALDTNAYTAFVAGVRWTSVVARASEVCLFLPVLAELRFGFLKGSQSAHNEVVLDTFLDNRCVSVICPDEQSALYYARLRLQLTRQGTPIPTHDLWISALTLQHNLHLCTDDQHFIHLPQLLRARPTETLPQPHERPASC